MSSVGGDRGYWFVPLDGGHPIYGEIELWIPFGGQLIRLLVR